MNANTIQITESTEIKTMSVADLLTAQDVGDIATPDIQRPAGVWNAEQCAKLEDTIMRGWGIGTISLVEIVKDGKTLRLLVDGLQRMTALRGRLLVVGVLPVPILSTITTTGYLRPCGRVSSPAGFIHFSRFVPYSRPNGGGAVRNGGEWALSIPIVPIVLPPRRESKG